MAPNALSVGAVVNLTRVEPVFVPPRSSPRNRTVLDPADRLAKVSRACWLAPTTVTVFPDPVLVSVPNVEAVPAALPTSLNSPPPLRLTAVAEAPLASRPGRLVPELSRVNTDPALVTVTVEVVGSVPLPD